MLKPVFLKWFIPLIAFIWLGVEAVGNGDFFIYCYAASCLEQGNDIYTRTYLGGYHYYYSVAFALVLKPLLSLPFYGLKFTWLALNLGAYLHLFYLLMKTSVVKQLSDFKQRLFLLLLFLLTLRVLYENIHTSQITILLLWCSVYGVSLVLQQKNVVGGFLIGLAINIKLMPIVLLPYLLYRGYYKALVWVLLTIGGLFFLPGLIVGMDYNMFLLARWWELINPTETRHVLDTDERSFHGLTTLLSTLLVEKVPDLYALPNRRHLMDVSLTTLSFVILTARLILVSLSLYFLGGTPFKKRNDGFVAFEISYILMVVPLIFPHQQHYGFIFMAPAMACILFVVVNQSDSFRSFRGVNALLIFVFLTFTLKLLLGEFNRYYEHYKILTYGALLLVPLLMWAYNRMRRVPVAV